MTEHQSHYQHWHLHHDAHDVLWLACDQQHSGVNTLNQAVLTELAQIVAHCEQQTTLRGIVLYSKKNNSFIVGADIREFSLLDDPDKVQAFIEQTQALFRRWQQFKIPTVAMIDGVCLGGGLELALACRYRVASDEASTQLGLPEIKLGIHPGWGGTIQLPALIGPMRALPAILKGDIYSAKQAKRMALVDHAVPTRQLRAIAMALIEGKLVVKRRWSKLWRACSVYPARYVWIRYLTYRLGQKVQLDHYPALGAVLNQWQTMGLGAEAWQAEARSVTRLLFSDTSHNLVRLFFLQERLKSLTKQVACKVHHVHVIGAGTMGADIATVCAQRGFRVTLNDADGDALSHGIYRAKASIASSSSDQSETLHAVDRLLADPANDGLAQADMVIEAVLEDMAVKQALFRAIEPQMKPTAVLATNTSSLPIDDLASVLDKPDRLVGVHFFNPVAKMRLVEVVSGKQTATAVKQLAMSFVGRLKKLPLPVSGQAGFCINRILMPYLLAAVQCLGKGHSAQAIDHAALRYGMPMGPLALADTIGLDVCLAVAKELADVYDFEVPELLQSKVKAGHLGKKSGRGFYGGGNRHAFTRPKKPHLSEQEVNLLTDQLLFPMYQEALRCWQQGVVDHVDFIDAGMVFGAGFAPFLGGPIHALRAMSAETIQQKLAQLEQADAMDVDHSVWQKASDDGAG